METPRDEDPPDPALPTAHAPPSRWWVWGLCMLVGAFLFALGGAFSKDVYAVIKGSVVSPASVSIPSATSTYDGTYTYTTYKLRISNASVEHLSSARIEIEESGRDLIEVYMPESLEAITTTGRRRFGLFEPDFRTRKLLDLKIVMPPPGADIDGAYITVRGIGRARQDDSLEVRLHHAKGLVTMSPANLLWPRR